MPNGYYKTPDGHTYIGNSFYAYICAVTDPTPCAYKIRVAEYYVLKDGCRAVRCVRYQFGYDEATGTCDYEFTKETTRIETVHSFTESAINTTEDGFTVTGTKYTCTECGSFYYNKNYYDATIEKTVKDEYYFENKLDDGHYAFVREVSEYDYSYAPGFGENAYIARTTYERPGYSRNEEHGYTYYTFQEINAQWHFTMYSLYQENDYWYRYDYTYDFTGSCTRTTTYTNSNGERNVSTDSCHPSNYRVTDKEPTCTQHGAYHYVCYWCGDTVSEHVSTPKAHNWVKTDEYYVCSYCGLENANGANGSIVMEDLTATLGNGENYVVGYWNHTLVKFSYYVCLYLNEPNAYGDYQVDLEGITVTAVDGINGYAFSKAEVAAAAEALGYGEGDYEVMFVFVPDGADGNFDYAIIFD